MSPQEMERLNEDLRCAVQVDIRGPRRVDGTRWCQMASSSRGYYTLVMPGTPTLLKVGKDNDSQEDWVKPLEEVGEIHIWINGDGPIIRWETSNVDGRLRRTN